MAAAVRLLSWLIFVQLVDSYRPEIPTQNVYRWNDREHNRDRTQALIDWAEGRKPNDNKWGPELEMVPEDRPTENFLELSDHHAVSEKAAQKNAFEILEKTSERSCKCRRGSREETHCTPECNSCHPSGNGSKSRQKSPGR